MTRQNDAAYGINRLESKNVRAAIIQKISADFNLMPKPSIGHFRGSFPRGNGVPMLSKLFSSDASNIFLMIGFMSMMKPKH